MNQPIDHANELSKLLWSAIDYAGAHPEAAKLIDPRTWQHLNTYSTAPQSDADVVLEALNSGGWAISRNSPYKHLTDQANEEFAWYVTRTCAPFCCPLGNRTWFGRTAIEALRNGEAAINNRGRKDEAKRN